MDAGQSCTACVYSHVDGDKDPCRSCVFDGGAKKWSNWTPASWVRNIPSMPRASRTIPIGPVADEGTRIVSDHTAKRPTDTQVGGNHYSKNAIQPIDYIRANKLGYCEGNVVKYITRWRDKGGVQDLQKAKHYIDFLIEEAEKK